MYHHRNTFNQAVVRGLENISPDHAIRLMREGEALGWWNAINYCRTSGQGVDAAVTYILTQRA